MTSGALAAGQTSGPDRLGIWCGWVMVGTAALTPWLAWLGPLGFAALLGLSGLLCLPAIRIRQGDCLLISILLLTLAWSAASLIWTVQNSHASAQNTILKLAAQLVLYVGAWHGARRADPALGKLALRWLAWGLAAYGALLLVEAMTGGAIYAALRGAIHDPIRADLGRKNLAQGSFVLALLWPLAAAAGTRAGAPAWLAVPMAAGTAILAQKFLSDAPALAVLLAGSVAVVVWVWPRLAPTVMGLGAAGLILTMPLLVLVGHMASNPALPTSWAQRIGYWLYAMARITDHPFRGWGLDASRAFAPHIALHPHNGALQLWLELGAVGAAAGALVWLLVFRALERRERDLLAAAAAGSAAVYLFLGLVSFGVWQEWWLALAAMVALIFALGSRQIRSSDSA